MSDERSAHMSSVLAADAVVLGNVRGDGDLEVRGKVQGNVILNGRVAVSRGGAVLGKIEALQITVHGEVRGDLLASDGVVIGQSGEVEGSIVAPRVAIEAGARVRGHLRTLGLDERPRVVTPSERGASVADRGPADRSPADRGPADRGPSTLAASSAPAPDERPPREEGDGRGRRRRRKRGSGSGAGPEARPPALAEALQAAPTRFAVAPNETTPGRREELRPAARPEAAPAGQKGQPQLKPPTIPSFVKGSHGHRRDNQS